MALRIEIVSRETIKPSCQTREDLRNFNLSLLDQLAATLYVPVVLFYPKSTDNANSSNEHLKRSLSRTLTEMYPLAGRQKNQFVIDCNDEGADYIDARVINDMSSVLEHPKLEHLRMLLPYNPHQLPPENRRSIDQVPLLSIQVNRFLCGGIAIGVCIRHVIADAAITVTFLNTWASNNASCYNEENGVGYLPKKFVFDCTYLFSPQDMAAYSARASQHNQLIQNTVTTRFVLSDSKIADLKKKCNTDNVNHPTRVEAVVSYFWSAIIAAVQSRQKKLKKHEMFLTVNLRKRMVPPIPPHSIGNVFQSARAQWEANEEGTVDYKAITENIIDSIEKVDDGYIKNGEFFKLMKERLILAGSKSEEVGSFAVSSWCRFPFYESDFGFGRPSWYGNCLSHVNSAILMDTSDGRGIEAWVALEEEDMEKLENNSEFLSFCSLTQTV